MASKSLGTLTLDIVAKIGGYEAGLDKAEKEAKKRAAAIEKAFDNAFIAIGAGFASMASAGAAALAVVNQQAEAIAGYQDLAEKIGDTAEAIASLQTAATVSGTSLEQVGTAFNKLSNVLAEGGSGAEDAAKALGAIGIAVDDFIKLSPVERIDAFAKALNNFADGPEKSVIAIQALGKAGAELIPFFNDLAEGSERNIRLTQEQIEAADAYTKQIAHLQDEFNKFLQQQSAELIPTLSQVVTLLSDLAKNEQVIEAVTGTLNVAIKAFLTVLQTIIVVGSDVIFVFKQVGTEIGGIAAQLTALFNLDFTGFRAISTAMKEDAQRARAELDKFQKQVMSIGQPAYVDDEIRRLQARSASNVPSRPQIRLPAFGSSGASGGGARRSGGGSSVNEFQRYLESLSKQLERTQDLTAQEQVLLDIQKGRLGIVNEGQKQQLLDLAKQIDANKEMDALEKERLKNEQEAQKIRDQMIKEGQSIYEATRSPLENYIKDIQRARELLAAGAIDTDTYARQVEKLGKSFNDAENPIKETTDQLDEFQKNLAQGVQSTIADALTNGFKGGFKDIEKSFVDLLLRLAAQAVAADLTKKLFGATSGGEGDGWLGAILGAFGGARALGGPVSPNTMYRVNEHGPEMFEAANGNQYLMTGSSGGNVISNNRLGGGGNVFNINVPSGTSRETGSQIAAEAMRKLAQGQRNQ